MFYEIREKYINFLRRLIRDFVKNGREEIGIF